MNVWVSTLISVAVISLLSLAGVVALRIPTARLQSLLHYLVSFAAGAMLGDVFLHLLPHTAAAGFSTTAGMTILGGMLCFFILEKLVHWQHCHHTADEPHPHVFATMNLVGDALHNFIDGMLIAGAFLAGPAIGVSTAVAVALHEIPQEIGDFGVLLAGGFSRGRALLMNLLSALTAVIGAVLILWLGGGHPGLADTLAAFTAGAFIYIAAADLIPELHKETAAGKSFRQILCFLAGVGIMLALSAWENHGHAHADHGHGHDHELHGH